MRGMANSPLPKPGHIGVTLNKGDQTMQVEMEALLRSCSVLEEEAIKRGEHQEADRIRRRILRLLEKVA